MYNIYSIDVLFACRAYLQYRKQKITHAATDTMTVHRTYQFFISFKISAYIQCYEPRNIEVRIRMFY
jgi:hypothetical protein